MPGYSEFPRTEMPGRFVELERRFDNDLPTLIRMEMASGNVFVRRQRQIYFKNSNFYARQLPTVHFRVIKKDAPTRMTTRSN